MKRDARERIEDIEFLLTSGCTPAVIASRLNTTASALERSLYRNGRPDLARLFGALVRQEKPRKVRRWYAPTFPRKHAAARAWAAQHGYPTSADGRMTKAAYTAWEQAQQQHWTEAA